MTEVVYFSDSSGRLFNWNQDTDVISFIGTMSQTMTDISVAPDGTLFGITFSRLYTIDPQTAAVSFVANHSVSGANALIIDPFGVALAAGSSSELLFSLDLATGAATLLGETGFQSAGDIALHRGRFYLSTLTNELVQINPNTGGAIRDFNHGVANVFGMSSGPSGFIAYAGDQIFVVDLDAQTLTLDFDLDDRNIISGSIYGAAPTDYGQSGAVIRGNATSEQHDGAGNDDIVFGAGGLDLINGNGGADLLFGDGGVDTLNGGAGNDTLVGGDGADVINGGGGVDTADYRQSTSAVSVNLATNAVSGGASTGDQLSSIENLHGSVFGDELIGDSNANTIIGDNGADLIIGNAGDDRLQGLLGDDSIFGGFGRDRSEGGLGNDFIRTGPDNDTLIGDEGDDTLGASNRTDLLRGGDGNDLLLGSNGNDRLFGDAGADTLLGGNGRDTIEGGDGNDRIIGGGGNDRARGGVGDDTFIGGAGSERYAFFDGEAGDDVILDFEAGAGSDDIIVLIGFGAAFDDFADVQAAATQVGADTVIDLGGGDSLTLAGVNVVDLHTDDFVFG